MHKSIGTPWLAVFLTLFGCSGGSGEPERSASQSGAGGGSPRGVSGSPSGGTSGFAGSGNATTGGMFANGETPGGGGAAGNAGGGGHAASAGADNGAGSVGVGGSFAGAVSASGGSAAGGGGASAPTFTRIYDTIITRSCGGAQCHLQRPTPYGYDFSSKTAASSAWRADVFPGDGAGSPLFQVLNFGIMPKDQPSLSIEELVLVRDWIDSGALDN